MATAPKAAKNDDHYLVIIRFRRKGVPASKMDNEGVRNHGK